MAKASKDLRLKDATALGLINISKLFAKFQNRRIISEQCAYYFRYCKYGTCDGEDADVAHAADVLQPEVPDEGAPAEEEGAEGEHGGDVAHADVADVDAPEETEY